MRAAFAFTAIIAALHASLAIASPIDIESRQSDDDDDNDNDENGNGAIGGGSGFDGPQGPVEIGQCFIGRVVGGGNPKLFGRFMDGHKQGQIHLHKSPKHADLWVIDPTGQLRLAYNPASAVYRDEFLHTGAGPLKTRAKGKKKDDLTYCNAKTGILQCQTRPGDITLSHGHILWVGQGGHDGQGGQGGQDGQGGQGGVEKRNLKLAPVVIAAIPVPCPAGPRPWESWN